MTDQERRNVAARLIAERMDLVEDVNAIRGALNVEALDFSRLAFALTLAPQSLYIDPGDEAAMVQGNVIFRHDRFSFGTFEKLAALTNNLRSSLARLQEVERLLRGMNRL